jgi:putative dimethyl sulfoxide reductase chaperone
MQAQAAREAARVRSQTYWFLSDFFLRRPDAEFLAALRRTLEAVPGAGGDPEFGRYLEGLGSALDAAEAEPLAAEFTRLFGGLSASQGPPPPFESVQRESQLVGDATQSVLRHYREAGFDAIDRAAGPQDHVGVELRFMALLCLREGDAWISGGAAAAAEWLGREARFMDEHLLGWVPEYCALAASESREPFYAAAAGLTAAACLHDRDRLEVLRSALRP